jgi:hypothetical protein
MYSMLLERGEDMGGRTSDSGVRRRRRLRGRLIRDGRDDFHARSPRHFLGIAARRTFNGQPAASGLVRNFNLNSILS